MRHQAGDERIGFDADSERRDADVREDAVEELRQQEEPKGDVAEQRPGLWLATYFWQLSAEKGCGSAHAVAAICPRPLTGNGRTMTRWVSVGGQEQDVRTVAEYLDGAAHFAAAADVSASFGVEIGALVDDRVRRAASRSVCSESRGDAASPRALT